jgi:hypothetical protein
MNDENYGHGGSYVINSDGARELVERTEERDNDHQLTMFQPPVTEPLTLTEVVQSEQPADAGFFSPVAPADQPTTE